jgi:putative ABC transport system substrate-binding protein
LGGQQWRPAATLPRLDAMKIGTSIGMTRMRRREFITLLGGAAAAWPLAARAQQARRIGVLLNGDATDPEVQNRYRALEAGLRDLGWIDGHNVNIDYRWALDAGSLRTQAAALVAGKPELVVAITSPGLAAAQQATGTIPMFLILVT